MKYKRNSRAAWRLYGETALIVTPDDSRLHKLNETASFVWSLLSDGPRTLEEIIEMVHKEFEVTNEDIAADIEQFLGSSCEKSILIREPVTKPGLLSSR